MASNQGLSLPKRVLFAALLASLPFVALALVEGAASLALFVGTLRHNQIADEVHTEYDTLLGWINLPNFYRADFYAPHLSMRTNAQRMRHDGDLAPRAPAGKHRVMCSGDSFTLGYGVGDADTWCAQLATDTSLETVNMGQGGYGIDQAYLWYLRDGLPLHPDVHLFAFVVLDIQRMLSDKFLGYPKPTLVRDGEGVRPSGVPVPRLGWGRVLNRLTDAALGLRSFELLWNRVAPRQTPGIASPQDSMTWALVDATLGDLARRDRAAGVTLVVVFLPIGGDFMGSRSDRWRRWAREASARHEFALVDLVEALRRTAPDSVDSFFIKAGGASFPANGHYTAEGNRWVASQLRRQVPSLRSTPGVGSPKRPSREPMQ